ncbi:MAG: 23S rRNA (pseudouridine(1915)-N(3))-methyltransferase RlmH [Acidobacteria bacterium]|nr:23S rRNA (pseudouridine(1915)-N(3))-methyltransferase RlmH [Acidobacteriota bacterium]
MKVALLWVGKTRNVHLQSLIQDYGKRLGHFCELSWREVQPVKTETAKARLAALEGERLLTRVEASDFLVLVDPAGQSLTTEKFAAWICKHRDQSTRSLVFVIGGHEGFSEAVRQRADFAISLSPLTFTHEMARCLLLEQIYRAFNLIHNFPYHK